MVLPQDRLLRFVRSRDGRAVADPGRLQEGRGAYLCATPSCSERLADGRALARALRGSVTVEPETLDLARKWQRSESTR